MDIALFVNLQRWSPLHEPSQTLIEKNLLNASTSINGNSQKQLLNKPASVNHKKENGMDPFSIFKPLSVKLIMVDHMTHYIHDILARFVVDTLHFAHIFPWFSPNLVSFSGLFLAILGSRLTLSNNLFYRQIGALLFEFRNLADSMDGVVARSRKREQAALIRKNSIDQGTGVEVPLVQYASGNYGTAGFSFSNNLKQENKF